MGLNRKIQRNQLRLQYQRFSDAWNNEKRFQQYLLAKGEPLEKGHQELGRKPTFAMWLKAVKNKQVDAGSGAAVQEAAQDPKKVEVEQTDWE